MNKENQEFEILFSKFMESVYATERETKTCLYDKIIHFDNIENTPYKVLLLLAQFIYKISIKEFDHDFKQLDNKLMQIHQSMEKETKEIYITFHFASLVLNRQYQEVEKFIPTLNAFKLSTCELKMLKAYYLFTYYGHIGQNIKCFNYYDECAKWCKKINSIRRFFNLEINYTNLLMQLHFYEESIRKNIELLELSKQYDYHNYLILLNNIAWGYMLLHQYKEALPYYLEGVKKNPNTDQFFYIALCYYQLNDNKNVRQFIEEGKKLNAQDVFTLLLEWLEAVINKPYSKKCKLLLERVLTLADNTLDEDETNFVLIQLEDYYYHVGEYDKAHEISHRLIDQ